MPRIRLEPKDLNSIAPNWKRAANKLDSVRKKLRQAKRLVDKQSLRSVNKINLYHLIKDAISKARELSNEADDLARQLEKIAQRFSDADRPSPTSFDYYQFNKVTNQQSVLPDNNMLGNIEIIAFGNQCLDQGISSQPGLYWSPVPSLSPIHDLTEQELQEIEHISGEDILEGIAHGALFIIELAAKHVPVIIFFDSNGEPLATSWMPDSFKKYMPYSMGSIRTA